MCTIVGVDFSTLSGVLFDEYDLLPQVHDRGGSQPEVWYSFTDPHPRLPIPDGGVVRLCRWGSRGRNGRLPPGGWTWRQTVEDGGWADIGCETEPVMILANFGYEDGIWFPINEGIHGVLIRRPDGEPVVYMVCEKPTNYYRNMTGSGREPCFVNQVM